MTIQEARDEYIRFDALVVQFPNNHAINKARANAYDIWVRAVIYWRLKQWAKTRESIR